MKAFNVRFPEIGVAQRPGLLRGYIRPVQGGLPVMHVAPPPGGGLHRVITFANGRRVDHTISGGLVVFDLRSAGGRPANWAVVTASAS